jgi:gliding motility-associated lipoprotein GldB
MKVFISFAGNKGKIFLIFLLVIAHMKYNFLLFFLIILLFSCSKNDKTDADVSGIDVNTRIERFDQKFYTSAPERLKDLKSEYPYLFPKNRQDTVWTNKMKDKDELELFEATQELYKDFSKEKEELNDLFRHIKYYFPEFKEPKVITLLTNVDYENRVILTDSLLLISLDVYLGKDHKFYQDYPKYIKQNFNRSHMIVDVAEKYAEKIVPPSGDRSFTGRIVQEGKKKELVHKLLPDLPDSEIMGYTKDQMEWATVNEVDIWKYFIENEMLFSNDPDLSLRFIDEAPFSKFYIANDKDSPGRMGVWFGWRIVRSYMDHNKNSLQKMLTTPNEIIFKRSKYKPSKN